MKRILCILILLFFSIGFVFSNGKYNGFEYLEKEDHIILRL